MGLRLAQHPRLTGDVVDVGLLPRLRLVLIPALLLVAGVLPLLTTTASGSASVTRTWTLSGVTFTDGGTMSGSFTLTTSGSMQSATMPSASITTAGGNTATYGSSTSYGPQGYNQGDSSFVLFPPNSGARYVRLQFPDLSNAQTGATFALGLSNSYECLQCYPYRMVTAGSVIAGSAVVSDSTPPVISATVNPATPDGQNGWYVGSPTVSFDVSDPDSAISSTTGCDPAVVDSDTAGTVFECSATSDGGPSSGSVVIKRDATPPDVSGSDVVATGWRNSPLSVSFSASDATSGLADPADADFTVTASDESAGPAQPTVSQGTVYDAAGNATTRTVSALIDTTAPVVTLAHTADGSHGWNVSSPVQETVSASDAASGVVDPPTCTVDGATAAVVDGATGTWSFDVAGDGVHAVSCATADVAGNVGSSSDTVSIGTSEPALTVSHVVDGLDGWNRAAPTVDVVSAADAPSGLDGAPTCTLDGAATSLSAAAATGSWQLPINADGTHSIACSVADLAGNTATGSDVVRLDSTDPTLTMTGPADGGWSAHNVIETVASSDGTSGLTAAPACTVDGAAASLTPATTGTWTFGISGDGSHLASCAVSDNAGNSTTVDRTVGVDTMAPSVSIAPSGTQWSTTSSVLETVSASDTGSGLSGVPTCTVDGTAAPLTSLGAGRWSFAAAGDGVHALACSVADLAGLTDVATGTARIDSTPPAVTASHGPVQSEQDLSVVSETVTASDGGSGLAGSATCTVDGVASALTAAGSGTWTFDISAPGSHEVRCVAVDAAGLQGAATDTVTIPTPDAPAPTPTPTHSTLPSASPTASLPATPSPTQAPPTPSHSPPPVSPPPVSPPSIRPTTIPSAVPSAPTPSVSVTGNPAPSVAASGSSFTSPTATPNATPTATPSVMPSGDGGAPPTATQPPAVPGPASAAAPADPVLDPTTGGRPAPPPGHAMALLDGKPTPATVTVVGPAVDITSGPLKLQIEAVGSDGTVHTPASNGTLLLDMGGAVQVKGEGYMPGTGIAVWGFSTPFRLGAAVANGAGAISATLPIPRNLGGGHHTVQINGMSRDGLRSLSLGLKVDPTGVPVWQPLDHVSTVRATQVALFAVAGLASVGGLSAVGGSIGGGVATPLAPRAPAGDGEAGRGGEDARREERGGETEEGGEEGESEQDILEALKGQEESETHHRAAALEGFLDRHLIAARTWAQRHTPGDRSATWRRVPGHALTDRIGRHGPRKLSRHSPLTARLLADGVHLRAVTGSAWLLGVLAGTVTGVVAALQVGPVAAPPAAAAAVAVAVGTIDAFAGFAAAAAFVLSCFAAGSLATTADWRGALGVASLFFIVSLIAGEARPLRRQPADTTVAVWHRLGDYLVLPPLGAWLVWRLVKALPALYGHVVPLSQRPGTLALVAGGALLVRLLVEDAAAWLYPTRLSSAAPAEANEPPLWRTVAGVGAKGAVFVFVVAPFVGVGMGLAIGAVLFLLPGLLALTSDRLPSYRWVSRVMPAGVTKITALLVLGYYLDKLVQSRVGNSTSAITIGFIVLSIPPCVLGTAELLGRGHRAAADTWLSRFLGTCVIGVCGYAIVTLSLLK